MTEKELERTSAVPFKVSDWKATAAAKKAAQAASIPPEWTIPASKLPQEQTLNVTGFAAQSGIMNEKEIQITELDDLAELARNIARGTWSALEVTTAYCKRAALAQQVINCLTEIFFDRALARANELDAIYKATGKVVGPLHGVPISLKDMVNVRGVDTSVGYVSWIGNIATENAIIADILTDAGAVLYVKTQLPLALMLTDTKNNLFGRTVNPHNRSLTAGGSSGGDGALIAFKGSPLSVGTDLAVSIRNPSANGGLFGLKPSSGRLPALGVIHSGAHSGGGNEVIPGVVGPITRSIQSVELFMKTILDRQPWLSDPEVLRMPWTPVAPRSKMTFAVIKNDGIITPHPPIQRAIRETSSKLLQAGHEVIELDVAALHQKAVPITAAIYALDGGLPAIESCNASGEPIYRELVKGPFVHGKVANAREVFASVKARNEFRKEYLDFLNEAASGTSTGQIDAIISPVGGHVAAPHDKSGHISYTVIWNYLDYSAGVVPITTVDNNLDAISPEWELFKPITLGSSPFTDEYNKVLYTGPEIFKDAPVCLQVISGRLQEERCVAAMKIIDDLVGAREHAQYKFTTRL